jgi:hypothetical protein
MKIITPVIFLLLLLAACQSATPLPDITAETESEFTLGFRQSATITDTSLTITLEGVTGDERCPSEIECAMSGPVSLSLSAQIGDSEPTDINLQVFTSNNGRVPDMQFEGIEDRTVFEGYLIRVVSVLPYPAKAFDEIKDSEYRVTFIVSKAE